MTESPSSSGKARRIFLLSLLVLMGIAGSRLFTTRDVPPELQAVLRAQPVKLNAFQLADQHGQAFTLQNLKGKHTLLFFGYLSCPDVCPTTLSTLNQVGKKLAAIPGAGDDLQVVFVSVDPKRDTPEKMRQYLAYFDPNFIGLVGDKPAIDEFTRQFNAGYMLEPAQADGNYLVSHTSSIFLIDPRARLIATFAPPHHVDTLVSLYRRIKGLS